MLRMNPIEWLENPHGCGMRRNPASRHTRVMMERGLYPYGEDRTTVHGPYRAWEVDRDVIITGQCIKCGHQFMDPYENIYIQGNRYLCDRCGRRAMMSRNPVRFINER